MKALWPKPLNEKLKIIKKKKITQQIRREQLHELNNLLYIFINE